MKKNILIKSFMTGISIALGGTVFLSCDNKYIGAFLFGIGLFIVLNFNCYLYTGKVGYLIDKKANYLIDLLFIWIGNFAGTAATAFLINLTRINKISEKANELSDIKLSDSYISVFILSIFCGMLMFIAADGYKKIENPIGKNIVTFLPVMVFILCGFEHCVANMFYFALSNKWTLTMFLKLLVMTAGNSVGGVVCNLLINRKFKESKNERC